MEQKERMDQGLIYDPADNRISTEQTSCLDAQYEFNATRPSEMKKRAALLKQMLGAIGENRHSEQTGAESMSIWETMFTPILI